MRLFFLFSALLFFFSCGSEQKTTLYLNGRIEGDPYLVESKYPGKVVKLMCDEGDSVEKGQPLAELDSKELNARLKEAEAAYKAALSAWRAKEQEVAALERQADSLRERISELTSAVPLQTSSAEKEVEALEGELHALEAQKSSLAATFWKAERDYKRFEALYRRRVISQSRYEQAKVAYENAKASLRAVEGKIEALKSQLAAAREKVKLSRTRWKEVASLKKELASLLERLKAALAEAKGYRHKAASAKAVVERVKAMLSDMVIRSPVNGVVAEKLVEPGEVVAPGRPLFVIYNLNRLYFEGFVPEKEIGLIHLGQRGYVVVDSYPGKKFPVVVTYVATKAEFTPKEVQTKEERVKEVFRVKLRLLENPRHLLKPGMPTDCYVYLERK